MEKVTLTKAARKAFSERLGRPIPDPDSEEFDELLEELREMQPDAYTDLYGALEHNGERLPVEKEALKAHKRAQRQHIANHLRNRQTHDGKRVPDKRKSLLLGLVAMAGMMGWMGYTTITRANAARAAVGAEEAALTEPVVPTTTEESSFGIEAAPADLGEGFEEVRAVHVQQLAPPVPAPPPKPARPAATSEPTRRGIGLPFGMDRPLKQTQDEPEDELPPVPAPPQPGIASAPPTSPYLPSQSGTATGVPAEPTVLPGNLSFVPPEATPEGPLNVLSAEEQQDTGLPSAPETTLAASSTVQNELPQDAAPPTNLGRVSSEEPTPAASTLGWEDADTQYNIVEEKSLSFAQEGRQEGLSEGAASPVASTQPLPPVPQVGGAVPPPPSTQEPAQEEVVSKPEVTDLSTLLTPGTQLQAELVTGVAAANGVAMPVIARTAGDWCGESTCSEITWIGEANYPGTDRVELTFTQAVVGNTAQSVAARAFGSDQLPGVQAGVRDVAPTAVQDVLRGAVGGASDYLDAFNSRETVILSEGEIIRQQAEPDLGTYLLGRGAELFSLPSGQTSIVRLAEIAPGTPFTVIYGL